MLIAQITDLHIKPEGEFVFRKVDTAAYLARAVAHIEAMAPKPDLVLATGDLVDSGLPEEYERLRALLAPLSMPVYLIPGNHDARDAMRTAFPDHRYLPQGRFLQYVVDGLPLRLIALDTLVPEHHHGELCDERLDWLQARLDESSKPTLLFMHHPPFETGIAWIDASRLLGGNARLAAMVRTRSNIERVLCGHVHRPALSRWAGTLASIAPSTAHQLDLTLAPDGKKALALDPPAVALHFWRPDAGLVTHLSFVPGA